MGFRYQKRYWKPIFCLFGGLAQSEERLTVNQEAIGSSPVFPAILLKETRKLAKRLPWAEITGIRMVRITAIAAVQKTEGLNGLCGFESYTIRHNRQRSRKPQIVLGDQPC